MKNILKHHSTADWDFSADNWELSTARYISPPTSLRETILSNFQALCKHASVVNTPNGEVRIWQWLRNARSGIPDLTFRNQNPLGTVSYANCYTVQFRAANTRLRRIVDDAPTDIGTWPYLIPVTEWVHIRIIFWTVTTNNNGKHLACQLFIEEAGEWQQKGETLFDHDPHFADSPVNKIGFNLDDQSHNDDIEVWGQ